MGTNYYTIPEPPCDKCGRRGETLHIGKSSVGWKFLFASYPERGLTSWRAWQEFLATRIIRDEWDARVDLAELRELVEAKQRDDMLDASDAKDDEGYRFASSCDFS